MLPPPPLALPVPAPAPAAGAAAAPPKRAVLLAFSAAAVLALCCTMLVRRDAGSPLFSSAAASLPPARTAPPILFSRFGDCAPVDWDAAPAVEQPELLLRSGVYAGARALNFTLAAPPPQSSFVSMFMSTSAEGRGGGMWAPVETLIFLHILRSASPPSSAAAAPLVVDVGVNVGYFSQLALALGATVVGFEPQARAQPYLARTARANGAPAARRWALFPCAIGPTRGHISMSAPEKWGFSQVDYVDGVKAPLPEGSDYGGHDGAAPQRIPMVRMADILSPAARVTLLKVDTEGFEAEIFKGVDAELLVRVEHVVVEVKTEGVRASLQALLGRAGFGCRQYREMYTEGSGVLRGGWVDTQGLSPADVAARLARELLPCDAGGAGPEDMWFSRAPFPAAA